MQIKEGHWYELFSGMAGRATPNLSDIGFSFRVGGYRQTINGHYYTDGRIHALNVKQEVLVSPVPLPWWEREGIKVGDYVFAFGFRLRQVTGFYEQGVLLEFADSEGIRLTRSNTWALSEQDFQGKAIITKEKRYAD